MRLFLRIFYCLCFGLFCFLNFYLNLFYSLFLLAFNKISLRLKFCFRFFFSYFICCKLIPIFDIYILLLWIQLLLPFNLRVLITLFQGVFPLAMFEKSSFIWLTLTNNFIFHIWLLFFWYFLQFILEWWLFLSPC